jgi:hypothetical protein
MSQIAPTKDPNNVEPYFFIWCSKKTGLNDGSASDTGELQGATITSYTVTVPAGITKDSDNKSAVTIHGVNYAISTVVTVWLSGGTDGTDYDVLCRIVTNETPARTLDATMTIPVRSN